MRKLGFRRYLVNEVLAMVIGKFLSTNHAMHIGLHKLLDQINLFESFQGIWTKDVEDANNILVPEMP